MNPPTLTILRPAQTGVNAWASMVATLACAGSAGVHLALVPEHLHESTLLGAAFLVDGLLLGAAAVLLADPARGGRLARLVVLLLAATAVAYVLSRTTGLPLLSPNPEPVDALGVITTLCELVGVTACVLLTPGREHR